MTLEDVKSFLYDIRTKENVFSGTMNITRCSIIFSFPLHNLCFVGHKILTNNSKTCWTMENRAALGRSSILMLNKDNIIIWVTWCANLNFPARLILYDPFRPYRDNIERKRLLCICKTILHTYRGTFNDIPWKIKEQYWKFSIELESITEYSVQS